MKEISIEHPNGYLLDNEGRVVARFGEWPVGLHIVPDHVVDVEYVDGPDSHDRPIAEEYRSSTP